MHGKHQKESDMRVDTSCFHGKKMIDTVPERELAKRKQAKT